MARLTETAAAQGLPVELGGLRLSLCPVARAWWLRDAGGEAVPGLAFPKPSRMTRSDGARAVWFGPGEALVFADEVAGEAVEMTDAIGLLRIAGAGWRDVLARLVPIDLREAELPPGAAPRTLVEGVAISVLRTDHDAVELMVGRSWTDWLAGRTLRAMRHVSERGGD